MLMVFIYQMLEMKAEMDVKLVLKKDECDKLALSLEAAEEQVSLVEKEKAATEEMVNIAELQFIGAQILVEKTHSYPLLLAGSKQGFVELIAVDTFKWISINWLSELMIITSEIYLSAKFSAAVDKKVKQTGIL